ncbi:LuxR family transcriptional regulator [Labedella phragmitis]|uniref:LuxR family transcriptional regulator n=1 Tax=Labedella phragmitis TaxID=2498849 RepID=A0A444PZ78_9MICO|nr:LuxR family transcriptional regulator [Labedella phragmitis]RWZ53209.1 LuxR family transcriptional regulator [Labedella phragmitis]
MRPSTPPDALRLAGVDEIGERVYRQLLSVDVAHTDSLAIALDFSPDVVAERLAILSDAGLAVQVASGGFTAVDPRASLRSLADGHARRVDALRSVIPELAEAFDLNRREGARSSRTLVITGPEAIGDWYGRVSLGVEREMLAFDKPPYVVGVQDRLQGLALARDVDWRSLYGRESFNRPGRLDEVLQDIAGGEQARLTESVPVKLALADRKRAILSLSLNEREPEALVTRSPQLIDALVALFELYWDTAEPLVGGGSAGPRIRTPSTGRRTGRPPTPDERTLLTLLSADLKDEVIARELGVSTRTLRRRMQDVFTELGAMSRFHAGVEAARRGWI